MVLYIQNIFTFDFNAKTQFSSYNTKVYDAYFYGYYNFIVRLKYLRFFNHFGRLEEILVIYTVITTLNMRHGSCYTIMYSFFINQ